MAAHAAGDLLAGRHLLVEDGRRQKRTQILDPNVVDAGRPAWLLEHERSRTGGCSSEVGGGGDLTAEPTCIMPVARRGTRAAVIESARAACCCTRCRPKRGFAASLWCLIATGSLPHDALQQAREILLSHVPCSPRPGAGTCSPLTMHRSFPAAPPAASGLPGSRHGGGGSSAARPVSAWLRKSPRPGYFCSFTEWSISVRQQASPRIMTPHIRYAMPAACIILCNPLAIVMAADGDAARAAYPRPFSRPPSMGKDYDTWLGAKGPDVGESSVDINRLPSRVDNSIRPEFPRSTNSGAVPAGSSPRSPRSSPTR